MKILGYESHPAADLFPLMDKEDLAALTKDVKAHGLRDPIVLCDGMILDGRNRAKACERASIKPRFVDWAIVLQDEGETDDNPSAVEWVLSRNLHRRHLSESQRGMIAAASLPMLKDEAEERRLSNLKQNSAERANLPTRGEDDGRARDKAAAAANVSPRTVASAAKVVEKGTQELQDAVRSGDVAVSAAAIVADESQERQRELVAEGPQAVRAAAKTKRQEKAKLTPVERFVFRVRDIAVDTTTKTAEQVRADLQAALLTLDAAQ